MLTSYGFTTVVDTASDLVTTTATRARIESGEVPGPRIFTAGPPLFPHDGIPYYFSPFPPEMLKHFHQPASLAEAVRAVRDNLAGGADITKLYTGSLVTTLNVKTMEEDWARAAVEETHRRRKLVFAHPTTVEGIRVAIESGADVLAHMTARRTGSGPWPADLIAEINRRHVSVTPTLKLWGYEMRKARVDDATAAPFTADGVGPRAVATVNVPPAVSSNGASSRGVCSSQRWRIVDGWSAIRKLFFGGPSQELAGNALWEVPRQDPGIEQGVWSPGC